MKHDPEKWKSDYGRDGYLVVPDVLDAKQLSRLRAALDDIAKDPDSLPPHLKRFIDFERNFVKRQPDRNELTGAEVGNAIRNIMELPLFNPLFAELIAYEPLLDVLETLFQSREFHFLNYKCIIKAPRVSSRFTWHRDLPYLRHTGSNLITAMLCIDEMTEANGATVVFPRSHQIDPDHVDNADIDIPANLLPDSPRTTVVCPAGSAVLFHVNIIHGGGANRSETNRRNVISIWAGPQTYPIGSVRWSFEGLMPRSDNAARRRQMRMTFPQLQLPE